VFEGDLHNQNRRVASTPKLVEMILATFLFVKKAPPIDSGDAPLILLLTGYNDFTL